MSQRARDGLADGGAEAVAVPDVAEGELTAALRGPEPVRADQAPDHGADVDGAPAEARRRDVDADVRRVADLQRHLLVRQDEPQVVDHAARDAAHADVIEQTEPDQGRADAVEELDGVHGRVPPRDHGRDLVTAQAQSGRRRILVLGQQPVGRSQLQRRRQLSDELDGAPTRVIRWENAVARRGLGSW